MRWLNQTLLTFLFSVGVSNATDTLSPTPNIVWIVVDDMSCHFSYQGEKRVHTPNVDRLAREGITFTKAYATAPVCSAFRSAMITGTYQTAIGAHHHRSSRGKLKLNLPEGIKTIPELFRDAGYYTTNANPSGVKPGKEDYNFVYERAKLYDGADWTKRPKGKPFFAQYQLRGGKLRNVSQWNNEAQANVVQLVTPNQVKLPPYYPDHPILRKDWADYLNAVQYTDIEVGRILATLKKENVLDETIIFFLTDHGISHARGKQFLYEEGVLIPFIVWAPERFKPEKRNDLIAHIDMSVTSLHLAGIKIPAHMQGRPLFGKSAKPREYVVSARDRCDETVDRIRGIRQGDFKYIRNFYPKRPYLQPSAYKDKKPFMPVLRKLFAAGKLNEAKPHHLAQTRPEEELYDLTKDPWEIHNLAADSAHKNRLAAFRKLLMKWVEDSNDQGRFPESEAMFDSDMNASLSTGLRKKDPVHARKLRANITLMKKWHAEGK